MRTYLFTLCLWSAAAFGYPESRLAISPNVDLVHLSEHPGHIDLSSDWDGKTIRIDASTVVTVDFERLFALSGDYNNFARFGMPHLDGASVVESDYFLTHMYVWCQMSLSVPVLGDQTSQHYLEVWRNPSGKDGTPEASDRWTLVRPNAQQLRKWNPKGNHPDDPQFTQLDGSWYQTRLANGKIYVRYYLAAHIDSSVPAFAIQHSGVDGDIKGGVRGVINTLAAEAARKP